MRGGILGFVVVGLVVAEGATVKESVVPGTVVERPGYAEKLAGWEEEAFSVTAGKVLGEVVDWLVGDGEERVVGTEATGFRPGVLEVVMDDGVVRVGRWDGEAAFDGELREVLGDLDGVHGKAKVVEVGKRDGGGWSTDVVVQIGGGGLQVNTRWEVVWDGKGEILGV
ncbi:MAG: hypothetical protein P8J87_17295, partial [Verrucomicrobiales bacterium]|nr:hypothetical protein [Verrucomicrobiales bacterium]